MVISRKKHTLHIIVPVYNEAENFPKLYEELSKKIHIPYELIVVYDFDEDTTVPVIKKYLKKDKRLSLVKNIKGPGVLNAILTGFEVVEEGPLLVTMADLSDDIKIVDNMYRLYLQGADIVCGSRYMKGGKQIGGPFLKRTLSRTAGLSLRFIRRFPTHDITNNFKLYDKAFIDSIQIESVGGFEIAMEITTKAFKNKKLIKEIPSVWKDRTAGDSNFKLFQWLPSYLKWYFRALF